MKKTLIILPGWGGSRETWQKFIKEAEGYFDVICIDLPCFGTEPCPNEVWGVEEYADFVIKKIQTDTAKPIILLGHSFGGQVAAYIAATHPQYVERLILSGAAALRSKKTLRRAFFLVVAKCGKLFFSLPIIKKFDFLAKKILYRGIDSPDYTETTGIKRDIFRKIIRQDLTDLLPKITVPSLLLWGKKDTYVSLGLGKRIARLIPMSRLVIIDNGKHGLHLTQSTRMIDEICSFVLEK